MYVCMYVYMDVGVDLPRTRAHIQKDKLSLFLFPSSSVFLRPPLSPSDSCSLPAEHSFMRTRECFVLPSIPMNYSTAEKEKTSNCMVLGRSDASLVVFLLACSVCRSALNTRLRCFLQCLQYWQFHSIVVYFTSLPSAAFTCS